jgi:hypothetical protein
VLPPLANANHTYALFVRRVPFEVTRPQFQSYFELAVGSIAAATLPWDWEAVPQRNKGYGFLNVRTAAAAHAALALSGQVRRRGCCALCVACCSVCERFGVCVHAEAVRWHGVDRDHTAIAADR